MSGLSQEQEFAFRLRMEREAASQTAPKESAATTEGRQSNNTPGGLAMAGVANAMNGPLMGFADELYGGLSAAGRSAANALGVGNGQSFKQNYQEGRDYVRGATNQFKEERPATALATSLAASAPTALIGPSGAVSATARMSPLARALQATGTGAGFGAASGAGESEAKDVSGVVDDTLLSSAKGGALGLGGQSLAAVLGAAGSNIAQRVSSTSAGNQAKIMLQEALQRSGAIGDPAARAGSRLRTLGSEATIADAGGVPALQQLDTLATLPGQAKNAVESVIHQRQAGRAGRLVGAADEALGTQGKGFVATLDALESAQKAAQAPLRAQLQGVSVRADPELMSILQREPAAFKAAADLARKEGSLPIKLDQLKVGDDIPFDALDTVKKALWTIAEKEKVNFAATAESRATNGIRVALTEKMDKLSPKDASGNSIYKLARDAFAGPAELREAITAGRGAMKADAIGVAEITKGMTSSELEAFRVGALQSLKDKVGTESGQTSLLKMWKEPATSGKLKEIFGNDYRAFAADVAREARLKPLESVGRGSQTASRLYGAGDLDKMQMASQLGQALTGAANGNPLPAMGAMSRAWNQVKTPEETRNELAKLLLQRGPQAQATLQELPQIMQMLNESRSRQATLAGSLSSQTMRDR